MYLTGKQLKGMFAVLCLGFLLLTGTLILTNNDNTKSKAKVSRLRWFGIETNLASAGARCGCGNCGSIGNMSFVEAVGHKDYTSYIFICNSCLQHTEFEPKGIPLSRWDID